MVDAQSFLDNLENVRLAMSVALERTQENRDQFVKNGTGEQVRQVERSISKVRGLGTSGGSKDHGAGKPRLLRNSINNPELPKGLVRGRHRH
jgi:hypothetical protein